MRKKIVIFTVSIGAGHHKVSEALKEEWEDRGYVPEIIDIFTLMDQKRADKFKSAYFYSIKKFPLLWDWTYQFTDNHFISFCLRPFLHMWWRELFSFFKHAQIDVVVSTHPLATQLGILMKKKLFPNMKLFSVLTDFVTHHMAFDNGVDATFVAEKKDEVRLATSFSTYIFHGCGIPLRKTWDERLERREIRQKLKLPSDRPIIVVSGGGEGLACYKTILSLLKKDPVPNNVYWFNGKGRGTTETSLNLENGTSIKFFPFSEHYADYVKGADFFISKPGGVSMAEVLKWNIPTGMISPLPGQERRNQSILATYKNMVVLDENSVISEILPTSFTHMDKGRDDHCSRKMVVDNIINYLNVDDSIAEKDPEPTDLEAWKRSIIRMKQWSS